jgi:hypothetical protein
LVKIEPLFADTPTAPVLSAFITAGWCGYPAARIEAGSTKTDLVRFIPSPPAQCKSRRALYVEPLGGGKSIVGGLVPGPKLVSDRIPRRLSGPGGTKWHRGNRISGSLVRG